MVIKGNFVEHGEIFGSNYQPAYSTGQSSITGTLVMQQKVRLSVTDLPLGDYRIGWKFAWKYSNSNNKFKANIEVDDDFTFLMNMNVEPKDPVCWHNDSGFFLWTDMSGSHFFDLDYGTSNPSHTAYISNAELEIWRVK